MPTVLRGSDNMDSAKAFGQNQTWQDKTASRVAKTQYLNDTGKPITVIISFNVVAGAATSVYMYVDGVKIISVTDTTQDYASTFTIVVPNGSTYEYYDQSTTSPIQRWFELR